MKKNQKKNLTFLAVGLLVLVGTYNAVMINSGSEIASGKSNKRLDEVYGDIKAGRQLAVATDWRKVPRQEKVEVAVAPKVETKVEKIEEAAIETPKSIITKDLDLRLVEVINPKKWEKGVQAADFAGSISANNGVIDSLVASLPEGLKIDIAFTELNGNVFEYDLDGEVYAGMMYQVDQNSYMVTMTNGPLEGTRLRFSAEAVDTQTQVEQTEAYLAENHKVQVGAFGEEMDQNQPEIANEAMAQTAENTSFKF